MSDTIKSNLLRQRPGLVFSRLADNVPEHVADCAELVLLTAGRAHGETLPDACPGDLIVFNKGARVALSFDEGSRVFAAGISGLRLYGLGPDSLVPDGDCTLKPTGELFGSFCAYFGELTAEAEHDRPLKNETVREILRLMLFNVFRLTADGRGLTADENVGYARAKAYFDTNYLTITTIDEVCAALDVSKYYLTHLFNRNLGIPPVKYLIKLRIDRACELLETCDDDVALIGKTCGYDDPCYFNRTFKRLKGVTPLRYRYLFKLKKDVIPE